MNSILQYSYYVKFLHMSYFKEYQCFNVVDGGLALIHVWCLNSITINLTCNDKSLNEILTFMMFIFSLEPLHF